MNYISIKLSKNSEDRTCCVYIAIHLLFLHLFFHQSNTFFLAVDYTLILNGKRFDYYFGGCWLVLSSLLCFLKGIQETTIMNMAFESLPSMWLEQLWESIRPECEDGQWHLLVPSVLVGGPLLVLVGWYL